ncbi:MAG: hypothetical protein U0168_28925 [Nannocystaceae bacterium]
MSITRPLRRPFTLVAALAGSCGAPALALAQDQPHRRPHPQPRTHRPAARA